MKRVALWMSVSMIVGVGCAGSRAGTTSSTAPLSATAPQASRLGPKLPHGYLEVEVKTILQTGDGAAVILVAPSVPDKVVPIFIGGTEATSIELRLSGNAAPRPLTHDLLDSVLARLGATIVQVQVDELRDSTYIGSVIIRTAERTHRLDARPSDAIALAIKSRAPIYIARAVVEEAGMEPNDLQTHVPGGPNT